MRQLGMYQLTFLEDRNILKCRLNMVGGNRMFGFIIPVESN